MSMLLAVSVSRGGGDRRQPLERGYKHYYFGLRGEDGNSQNRHVLLLTEPCLL